MNYFNSYKDWNFNYNFWTGATRQDFSSNGSIWCPARVPVSTPWEIVGANNKRIKGKADCIALQVSRHKANFSSTYMGNLVYRKCSLRQRLLCRVKYFYELSIGFFFITEQRMVRITHSSKRLMYMTHHLYNLQ